MAFGGSELEYTELDNVDSTSNVYTEDPRDGHTFIRPEQATEDESSGYFTPNDNRTVGWPMNLIPVPSLSLLPTADRNNSVVAGQLQGRLRNGDTEPVSLDSGNTVGTEPPLPRANAYGVHRRTHGHQARYSASSGFEGLNSTTSMNRRVFVTSHKDSEPLWQAPKRHATSSTSQTAASDSKFRLGNLVSSRLMLHARTFKDGIIVTLGVLLVFQLFLVMYNSFVHFGSVSSHSGCQCSFPFAWLLTFSLRLYSRIVIPFCVAAMFIFQLAKFDHKLALARAERLISAKNGTSSVSPEDSLLTELLNPHNDEVVRSVTALFCEDRTASLLSQLTFIRQHFDSNLKSMLLFSLLQPVIVFFALYFFNVFESRKPGIARADYWIGVADMTSLSLVSAATGAVLSIYFTEILIKKCICKLYRAPGARRPLVGKAKRVENYIMNRNGWYLLEIGMQYSCVIYPLLLIMSWASEVPLSCGFSVDRFSLNQDSAVCWLVFVASISVGQFLISIPLKFKFVRYVGLATELILLAFLWLFAPNFHWSEGIHILYAMVPMCFLMWYLIASVDRQVDALWGGKDLPTHISRLLSRLGFIVLVLLSLILSLVTEYRHVHPVSLDKYR